jgi:hypothetical protein
MKINLHHALITPNPLLSQNWERRGQGDVRAVVEIQSIFIH